MTCSSRPSAGCSVRATSCRSALVRSGIPSLEYALNPYTGCRHGCRYCYATWMARYSGHDEPWGSFVDIKENLVEVLRRQVQRLKPGRVGLATVCDAYQPVEAETGLTRRALEVLVRARFPVQVMTKSDLVCRDADLSMTITTLDEDAARLLEPGAPRVEDRLRAVAELARRGIRVTVFFGPVLPFFSDAPDAIGRLFDRLEGLGVNRVLVDRFNYLRQKLPGIRELLADRPEALARFEYCLRRPREYNRELRRAVAAAARGRSLPVQPVF
jgi:DNA repair photolyase